MQILRKHLPYCQVLGKKALGAVAVRMVIDMRDINAKSTHIWIPSKGCLGSFKYGENLGSPVHNELCLCTSSTCGHVLLPCLHTQSPLMLQTE